jgi:hypothetical protein
LLIKIEINQLFYEILNNEHAEKVGYPMVEWLHFYPVEGGPQPSIDSFSFSTLV